MTASTATTSPDNVIRLSLLRAPTWPDPVADRGDHRFTYRLLPHAGDLRDAGVIDAGYDLNVPLRAVASSPHAGGRDAQGSMLSVDTANAVVEVVKEADDGSGALVVRLYESWGRRGPVTVTRPWPLQRASLTDLLERHLDDVPVHGATVTARDDPFPDHDPQARASRLNALGVSRGVGFYGAFLVATKTGISLSVLA